MASRTLGTTSTRWGSTIDLADADALTPAISGAKAAALARAHAAGLPVLPGTVLTVDGADRYLKGDPYVLDDLQHLWQHSNAPVVVRSSSTVEDQGSSSMAGMFTSVLGVGTWDDFLAAIDRVLASAGDAPMAVLIQPQLDAARGGVMFGLDPVTGRRDRLVVATVTGGPDALVSGRSTGSRTVLTFAGRRLEANGDGPRLGRGDARRLAALAERASNAFDGAQDVEWAIDRRGDLWLLQSRPITAATSEAEAEGPIFGPGPVAETFPDPLSTLEIDLWIEPLHEALVEVLPIVGAAGRRAVHRSPLLIEVGGRAAIDLKLIGALPKRGFIAHIDPRPGVRRLRASWRVGRLRAALPSLARDVLDEVDDELARFPSPDTLSDRHLLEALAATRRVLVAIHGHELMAGLLSSDPETSSGAAVALRELAAGRQSGLSDAEIVARYPSTLALSPPQIGRTHELPMVPTSLPAVDVADGLLNAREELRSQVRLVQELGAHVAMEVGRRLAARGLLAEAAAIRWLHLEEIESIVDGSVVPLALDERVPSDPTPPLPSMFRLTSDGDVVATTLGKVSGDGQGVSAGRAEGTAFDGTGEVPEDAILVVRTLDPSLATMLPRLAGLVAETGSVLSHLAILAREFGVPTVVDVPGAVDRFAPGTRLTIDGSAGDVSIVEGGDAA